MKLIFALLLSASAYASLLWPDVCRAGTPRTVGSQATPTAPAPVKPLSDDPLLQTPVTLDVVEKPLGDVLAGLNTRLKLDLTAERDIADQRVTLHVTSQPVYALMAQLLCLLSHDAQHPHGYHWGPLDRSPGERPDYQLWRDIASRNKEQDALDAPRLRLAEMLRDMRRDAQPPPQNQTTSRSEAATYSAIMDDPYNKAFRNLTDDQIDALVSGETIPLDPALFSTEIANVRHVLENQPVPSEPVPPALRVVSADTDEEMGRLDLSGKFYIYLDGVGLDEEARDLDANSTPSDPDPYVTPLPTDVGPRVDLSPFLSARVATPLQRGDLGFTLQALAKAAHIDIYDESFLRTCSYSGNMRQGLDTLQGSVPRLVAQICALWNYRAQPVPGGYLFWSRTWAQDRAWDVPERLIAPWRQRLKEKGVLSLYDRSEIDAALTWPQVTATLDPALPTDGVDDSLRAYRLLNLFGSLTSSEQTQALSPEGLPISEMSADGQAALAADYQGPLSKLPSDVVSQAVLTFQVDDPARLVVTRVVMSVKAGGQELLGGQCFLRRKTPALKSPVTPAS